MNNELMVVKQLPIIEERLKVLSDEIDGKISTALALECSEDTVKEIKTVRASLNKEFNFYEDGRKQIKTAVLKPYDEFEVAYKKYVSDKYSDADKQLKTKIDEVEKGLKLQKEKEVREYFEEYLKSKNIDFIYFHHANVNVTLSATLKSLKEQVKNFIDKVDDDLKLIDTQEHKAEILVEYKQNLNVSNAITSVNARHKAIEEEKARQEELERIKALENAVVEKVELASSIVPDDYEEDITLNAPEVADVNHDIEEKEYTVAFKVTATKDKLIELKQFLNERGYKYE